MNLHFTAFPTLTTDRLTLRQLTTADADEIFLLRSDEQVNAFIDRDKATSIEDAIAFIQRIETAVTNGQSMYWAISLNNNETLIGTILLFNLDIEKEIAEIGYELIPKYHGQGIMQEAIAAVIEFAFTKMQVKTLVGVSHSNNAPSIHLLKKNKFMLDKELKYTQQEELSNFTGYYLNNNMLDKNDNKS